MAMAAFSSLSSPRSATTVCRPLLSWFPALLVFTLVSSSHAFLVTGPASAKSASPSTRHDEHCLLSSRPSKTTALSYGSQASSGPMSEVDSSKSGGCPFLDNSYVYKAYAVPALFSAEDSRPIVLFDGECNLCNKFVQTLLTYDSCSDDERGNLRFAALQSRVGDLLTRRMSEDLRAQVLAPEQQNNDEITGEIKDGEEEEKYKTMVVCGPDKTYIESSAVFQILQSLGGPSKRLKAIQYLALVGYVIPTRVRDRMYKFVSKRRKKWFGSSNECFLWDDRFDDRFVDDGVLTGIFREPFADPNAKPVIPPSTNLFESESPPARGDEVRIIWPADAEKDPSISFDDEFPNGICITGGTGKITTIDLPMRVVMRVNRKSLGLGLDAEGGETMIAWVKPQEVAAI